MNLEPVGEICYNAYKEAVNSVAWNGDKMKEYDELPERLQIAWKLAGLACQKNLFNVESVTITNGVESMKLDTKKN